MVNQNIVYIGENLKVFKENDFQKYINKIDTIYIDPPYNTKNIFSYNDKKTEQEWNKFMTERLTYAIKLLKETGVIFISIDDNEYASLKIICNNIFGEINYLGTFITCQSKRSNNKYINTVHEYILCYAKNKKKTNKFKIKRIFIPEDREIICTIQKNIRKEFENKGEKSAKKLLSNMIKKYCYEKNISWLKNYSNIDENGFVFYAKDLSVPGNPKNVNIPEIGLKIDALKSRSWVSNSKFKKLHNEKKLIFKNNRPYEKHLLIDAEDNITSILNFYSRQGTNDLKKLGLENLFDTPKPVELIKYLIRFSTPQNGIVLDFFAGSGTTGQAVLELNKQENSQRSFILIQEEEPINFNSNPYKICVSKKIKPFISEILLLRLKTYIEKEKSQDSFSIKYI